MVGRARNEYKTGTERFVACTASRLVMCSTTRMKWLSVCGLPCERLLLVAGVPRGHLVSSASAPIHVTKIKT